MELKRHDGDHGWRVTKSGDNGYELISYVTKMRGFPSAMIVANTISLLVTEYGHEDTTQIHIASFEVAVIMSAPSNQWQSKSHKELAIAIDLLAKQSRR